MSIDQKVLAEMQTIADFAATTAAKYSPEAVQGFISHLALTSRMVSQTDEGWAYRNYYDAVLRESEGPAIVPLELPPAFEPMEPRMCFSNCWELALDDPNLTYCEGFAHLHVIPVEHAWLVDKDGRIVDPTWTGLGETGEAIYMGVKISTELLTRLSTQTGWASVFGGDTTLEGRHQILRRGFKMHEGVAIDLNEVRT